MSVDFFRSLRAFGDFKLEMTVADFLNAMDNVAKETEDSVLAKKEKVPNDELLTREEVMKMLKVTETQTMIRWEEKGFLIPYNIHGQIFYFLYDILVAFKKFCNKEVFHA